MYKTNSRNSTKAADQNLNENVNSSKTCNASKHLNSLANTVIFQNVAVSPTTHLEEGEVVVYEINVSSDEHV